MTTREIVAVFLFYMGLQTLSASILYGAVAAGSSDASVIAFFTIGVTFIAAGIIVLMRKKEADDFAAISIPPD